MVPRPHPRRANHGNSNEFNSGEGGIRSRTDTLNLVEPRADSTGTPDVREGDSASSCGLVHDARSSVVTGLEATPREAAECERETIERAVVVEAVERAMQAFGVGRLDLAFATLRGLLTLATGTTGS